MAVTLTQPFTITTIALPSVANRALKVTPPEYTRYLWIQFRSVTGLLAYAGTDGQPIGGDTLQFAPDEIVEVQHPGDKPIYLASATPDAIVAVVAVERA